MIAPWWSFPAARVGAHVSLLGHLAGHHLPVWALMTWMIVLGTIVPFFLLVSALRHLPATRVAIIAMLEPVVATVVAWAWLGESLARGPARRRAGRARRDRARADRAVAGYDRAVAKLGDLLAAQLVALAALDAVEQVAYERRELDRVERLRHVVDAAEVEPARPVAELRARGEEDDRDAARALVVEQLLGDLPAVEPRHHHVEQDHVGQLARAPLDAARPVGGLDHLHPLRLEVHAAEQPDRRLVVDDEHARRARPAHPAPSLPNVTSLSRAPAARR